MTCLPTD